MVTTQVQPHVGPHPFDGVNFWSEVQEASQIALYDGYRLYAEPGDEHYDLYRPYWSAKSERAKRANEDRHQRYMLEPTCSKFSVMTLSPHWLPPIFMGTCFCVKQSRRVEVTEDLLVQLARSPFGEEIPEALDLAGTMHVTVWEVRGARWDLYSDSVPRGMVDGVLVTQHVRVLYPDIH